MEGSRLLDIERNVGALLDWYAVSARDLPWRRTRDPYAIWVSEIMLQQTQVRTVIAYWERWMAAFPTVLHLARAPEARVLKLWEGLGYYRRARHLHAAARQLAERADGRFPNTLEAILELPGIGRYTAGAIHSIAFNQPSPILDGNVIRVLTRWLALAGDPAERTINRELWRHATEWVEAAGRSGRPDACSHLNQALMELGATVCVPRAPRCQACPLASTCQARRLGRVEDFPETAPRTSTESLEYLVWVIRSGARYAVQQRPKDTVNGGLWEFPSERCMGSDPAVTTLAQAAFGPALASVEALVDFRHSITRFRIRQRAYLVTLHPDAGTAALPSAGKPAPAWVWKTRAGIDGLAMSAAHRKIADALAALPEPGAAGGVPNTNPAGRRRAVRGPKSSGRSGTARRTSRGGTRT